MRIGMIHQPHFLPWPGYLARCLAADVFVALDEVKFNRNHFQQRTKFAGRDGRLHWLTLPIASSTRSDIISRVLISSDFNLKKWQRPIIDSYCSTPFFDQSWHNVTSIISAHYPSFCDVSLELLMWQLNGLCDATSNPRTEILRTSQLKTSNDRSMRLVEICRCQRITHLIMGRYALKSHDVDLLIKSGISLLEHKYVGPSHLHPVPGVMGLHAIVRYGWEYTSNHLTSHWTVIPIAPDG